MSQSINLVFDLEHSQDHELIALMKVRHNLPSETARADEGLIAGKQFQIPWQIWIGWMHVPIRKGDQWRPVDGSRVLRRSTSWRLAHPGEWQSDDRHKLLLP
jgi:hypothetical protein